MGDAADARHPFYYLLIAAGWDGQGAAEPRELSTIS